MTPLSEMWRYVDRGAVDAFENNAQMAVLARSTSDAAQPILQTSVWGATHLNVGWFDDVDGTLDLAACERLGIQVIGRPFAGGGTAFYERGCAVADVADVQKRIASVFEGPDVHQADATTGVTTDDLVAAVQQAVADAQGGEA
jgi:lipoate-protein ligase A